MIVIARVLKPPHHLYIVPPQGTGIKKSRHAMKSRWIAIAALTLGVLGLFLAPTFVGNHNQEVAVLERLAPKVERTQSLAPETRDAIMQLVERVRSAPVDQRTDSRRAIAIDRIAAALNAKDGSRELTSVGRGTD
jgi:hypothetical protein